jgi:hypothetical protein
MATTQTLMLENIRMEYHSFRKDQVLTDKQLNDLIDYFEDQDSLQVLIRRLNSAVVAALPPMVTC